MPDLAENCISLSRCPCLGAGLTHSQQHLQNSFQHRRTGGRKVGISNAICIHQGLPCDQQWGSVSHSETVHTVGQNDTSPKCPYLINCVFLSLCTCQILVLIVCRSLFRPQVIISIKNLLPLSQQYALPVSCSVFRFKHKEAKQ